MEFKDKIKLSGSFTDNKFKEGNKIAKGTSLSSNQQGIVTGKQIGRAHV